MPESIKEQPSIITAIKDIRREKNGFITREAPEGIFEKCLECDELFSKNRIEENFYTCPNCDYHFNISPYERMDFLLDSHERINNPFKFIYPL